MLIKMHFSADNFHTAMKNKGNVDTLIHLIKRTFTKHLIKRTFTKNQHSLLSEYGYPVSVLGEKLTAKMNTCWVIL